MTDRNPNSLRRHLPLFTVALITLLIVIGLHNFSVDARTPPVGGAIPKPDGLILQLPFASGTASNLAYTAYGDSADHQGLDYYALDFNVGNDNATGQPIYPVAAGTVILLDWIDGYGNVVLVEHELEGVINYPNYVSLYAHLSRYAEGIQQGRAVYPDTIIGYEGTAGTDTIHLHFAMRYCEGVEVGDRPLREACINGRAVVPEPILGEYVYEGLGWWHDLHGTTNVVAAARPNGDHTPPGGSWQDTATGNGTEIRLDRPVNFDIQYDDAQTGVGEIRLTAYYNDWAGDEIPAFPESQVWRIIARCRPADGDCGANHWQFTWNPYLDPLEAPVPWLPKAKAPAADGPADACISFDIFDQAGNPLYAPGGTQCNFSNAFSTVSPLAPQDNQARLIRIMPLADGVPAPDDADFTGHESPGDDVVVSPGQAVHKTWEMRNTGSSTWGADYDLVFTGGDQMDAPEIVGVPTAAPGETVQLGVNIVAPAEGGVHRGYWRLRNPQGTYFGDRLWVQVNVPDDEGQPPSSGDISLQCLNCPAEVTPGYTFRPTVRLTVNRGQLLQSRGDMLRHKSGERYGAFPHVAVEGIVNEGHSVDLTFYDPITAPGSDGTYENVWQVWQDGRWAGQELAIRFTVRSGSSGANHRPNRPQPLSPHDWYVYYSGNTAHLCAQSNGDPDNDAVTHYYFEIHDSAQNWNSGWTTGSCVTTSALGPYNYQWRVRVRDSRGLESEWSESWHFTLVNPNLTINELYVEELDSLGEIVRVRACTEGQGGVGVTMRVSVNSAPDGSDNGRWQILKELGVPCFNEVDAPTWNTLEYATGNHLIRVEAHGSASGWDGAAVREMTYYVRANHRPGPPHVQEPRWDSYVSSRTVNFRWVETLRTDDVHLQVAADPAYNTLLLDTHLPPGTTSYTHTFAQAHTILYGRVVASGPYGSNEGGIRFGIDETPPSSHVNGLPETVDNQTFQVTWSGDDDASGLRWYHIQVRQSDRPHSQWQDWLVNSTKTGEQFEGQPGETYAFRARAMDDAGNWESWPAGAGDAQVKIALPTSGSPDLTITDLNVFPNPQGGIIAQAVFTNQGDADTQNGFYTDLYVDHLPTGAGDYTGSLQFWINDAVAPGAVVTASTPINGASQLALAPLAPGDEVAGMLYAQVDSNNAVREPDDVNNVYAEGAGFCLATADAFERAHAGGDNGPGTASPLPLSESQVHNFERPGDEDWLRIQAQQGVTYTVRTLRLASSADTYLALYDSDGATLLASNDDADGVRASRLTWNAPATGVYYLKVRQWNPNIAGCGTQYTVSFIEGLPSYTFYLPSIFRPPS